MTSSPPENIHATGVLLGDRCLLIIGPSGSGKTTLAFALIDHFSRSGVSSRLVADDQLFVTGHGGRLICRAPSAIAGLVEIPGLGPRPIPFEPAAVVDLCVRLVPSDAAARFQDPAQENIASCIVPRIDLAERKATAARTAVIVWLSGSAFD